MNQIGTFNLFIQGIRAKRDKVCERISSEATSFTVVPEVDDNFRVEIGSHWEMFHPYVKCSSEKCPIKFREMESVFAYKKKDSH